MKRTLKGILIGAISVLLLPVLVFPGSTLLGVTFLFCSSWPTVCLSVAPLNNAATQMALMVAIGLVIGLTGRVISRHRVRG
jgi:hypothetical protein